MGKRLTEPLYLPRQYAGMSLNFLTAFAFLVPFSLSASGLRIDQHELNDSLVTGSHLSNSYASDSIFSFHSRKGFVPSLVHNFGEQATAPFRMSSSQALMLGGGIFITGVLLFTDEQTDHFFKPLKDQYDWIHTSSPQVSELGANYGIAFIGLFGGYGLVSKNRKAVRTSLLAAQAAITSGIWVRLGKMLASRERPSATYVDYHHDFWWGPFQQFNSRIARDRSIAAFDAFPSGHTATAFSIASVFAHQYSETKAVPVIAYTLATLVGISRLTEHTHWASDAFTGACIGYLCGKQVVHHEKELEAGRADAAAKKRSSTCFFSLSGEQLQLNYLMTF